MASGPVRLPQLLRRREGGALAVPGFPPVAAAYVVNEAGNWLGEIALAVLVFDRTGSALATAALFLAARFLPALIAPALATRLEALPGNRALPALHLAESLAFGLLALAAAGAPTGVILALAAVDGLLAIAAKAMLRATTAGLLVPRRLLREGNAVLNTGFTLADALGPIAGGGLVAAIGVGPTLALDAVSFLVAAALLARAPELPFGAEGDEGTWRTRLRAGVRYATTHPRVRLLLGAQAVGLVFFTLVVPIEIVFVKDVLGGGTSGYGALLTSWGVGMVLGAWIFARAKRVGILTLLLASSAAVGLGYVGLALSPTLLVACLCSLVGGAGNGVEWVALLTALQAATEARVQVGVMALFESLSAVMPGLGFALGGVIATVASPRAAYAVAGAGVLLLVAGVTVRASALGGDLRRLERRRPAA